MSLFPLHTLETAPADAHPVLQGVKSRMGFVPNLLAKLAEAPAALEAYTTLSAIFDKTSLSPGERQVVLLTTALENRCEFCVAAHSAGAKHANVAPQIVNALRQGLPVSDPRLKALSAFARVMVHERGWVDQEGVTAFLNAGFTPQNVLEVIVGVTLKTLSNYTSHIVGTPLNDELRAERWSKEDAAAQGAA